MAAQKAPQAPLNRRTTYQGAGARSTGRGSVVTTGGGGSTVTINPGSSKGATRQLPATRPASQPARPRQAQHGRPASATARRPASPRPSSPGQGGAGRQRQGRRGKPAVQLRRRPQPDGPGHNYQAIVLAEFVAAELLVAATPIATRKNQPGLSPYVPQDIVKLVSIGVVYLILELIAAAGGRTGRFCAWFGALVLLVVGLNEAAALPKVLSFLSGGTGAKTKTTVTTAAAPTAIQQALGGEATITDTNPTNASSSAGGGGTGPTGGGIGPRSGTSFVQEAAKFIGTPYRWGGASPGGFDCSGLVQYALEKIGLKGVPRTSEQQWAWVQRIPQSELSPGDLIFEQWPGEVSPGHVAIYSGNGQIIQAPAPGQDVQRAQWSPSIVHAQGGQIVGYGRVPGLHYGPPVSVL